MQELIYLVLLFSGFGINLSSLNDSPAVFSGMAAVHLGAKPGVDEVCRKTIFFSKFCALGEIFIFKILSGKLNEQIDSL